MPRHSNATLWFVATLMFAASPAIRAATPDGADWPTYNYDNRGTRHNRTESMLSSANVGALEVKWTFPAEGDALISPVHTTPIVINSHVYFGTAGEENAFYKLKPDGTLQWKFLLEDSPGTHGVQLLPTSIRRTFTSNQVLASAVVAEETVFFVTRAGRIYAVDAETGEQRWMQDTRQQTFPLYHMFNVCFAAPIFADGKLIVAGGSLEQWYGLLPGYQFAQGRGFILALEPDTGEITWIYALGEEPKRLDPPVKITHDWGTQTFYYGPSTASIWSTPSYDEATRTLFFGTDTNNSPRQPTPDNPSLSTKYSDAVVAIGIDDGTERWVTQIVKNDVFVRTMRGYSDEEGEYKDASIGDTPKIYSIMHEGQSTKVVGVGCKNGGFYVLRASDGEKLGQTPIYKGPPEHVENVDARTLALPGPLGGLQTGCAFDGTSVITNGIDYIRLHTQKSPGLTNFDAPTAGRVTSVSADLTIEHWRHERPTVQHDIYGSQDQQQTVGDPVASGIALANGIAFFTTTVSGKLIALDTKDGAVKFEQEVGAVWCGPSVSRGHVYVGTGNSELFSKPISTAPADKTRFAFPFDAAGKVICFGLPE